MSTADEINLTRMAAEVRLMPLQRLVGAVLRTMESEAMKLVLEDLWVDFSRTCHAARARKLRRRGMDVRFDGRTSTGKARYRWAKPLPKVTKC